MAAFNEQDLQQALEATGIRPGSLILVHSALFALGRMEGVSIGAIPARIYDVLRHHLGAEGTVAVPTFNFDFCDGVAFHRQHTPSVAMGAFSEFVRQLPQSRRSPHPLQSLAAIGPLSKTLAERDTPGAFEPGGSFDALLEHDVTIVMLGCGINAVSLVHWAEERVGVPYRYWKSFSGHYRDGRWTGHRTYRLYARDLVRDPEVRVEPVGSVLEQRGQWRRAPLGNAALEACQGRHFTAAAVSLLQKDPTSLIRSQPRQQRRPRATG